MGDVIHLPTPARLIERYTAIKSYGKFGRMSVELARMVTTEPAPLALILDGLPPGVGFEVLARFHDTAEGIALADLIARSVTLTLMHVGADD